MEIQAEACQYMLKIHLLIICKLYIYLLKSKLKTMISSLNFEHQFSRHSLFCRYKKSNVKENTPHFTTSSKHCSQFHVSSE